MKEVTSRKGLRLLISVLCILMMTSVFASGIQYSGTVLANDSIVRGSNSFDGEVLAKLQIGTKVLIEEINNDWYRITDSTNSLAGWMYKDLVSLDNLEAKTRRGRVTASILNVRMAPSTDSSIIKKLASNDKITIINQENDWFEVALSLAEKGWVHSEYIQIIPNFTEGKIVVEEAVLMKEKDLNSEVIKSLQLNTLIYIKDYQDGWYNILLEDFTEGWIIGSSGELQISSKAVNRSAERTEIFGELGDVTSKYLGKKYSWGKSGPNQFDCSGFTTYIFNTYYEEYLNEKGIDIPRTSRDQATIGNTVGIDELMIGDLVFFNTETRSSNVVTHVGIYLGNGDFVHASSYGGNVIISSIEKGYYRQRFLKAIRL